MYKHTYHKYLGEAYTILTRVPGMANYFYMYDKMWKTNVTL